MAEEENVFVVKTEGCLMGVQEAIGDAFCNDVVVLRELWVSEDQKISEKI